MTLDDNTLEIGRIPWLYKQKIVQSCVTAGIHIELCYGHALKSSERRRQFFAQARKLMEITGNGRGVVLSSGAEDMISLRGPYDVSNLCSLFGLPPKCGRKFVSSNARDVLLRAQTRRTIKGAIHVADLASASHSQPQIPSASGKTTEESIRQLAKVEEFAKELDFDSSGNQGNNAASNDQATILLGEEGLEKNNSFEEVKKEVKKMKQMKLEDEGAKRQRKRLAENSTDTDGGKYDDDNKILEISN